MGLAAIDLLGPADWDLVSDHGLVCSMGYPTDRNDFIATRLQPGRTPRHAAGGAGGTIPLARQHGVPNVIAMFGNRAGISDDEGAEHCIAGIVEDQGTGGAGGGNGLRRAAEQQGGPPRLPGRPHGMGSPGDAGHQFSRVKLLYDIYHLQIMEGDVIRTIRTTSSTSAIIIPAGSRSPRIGRQPGAELPGDRGRIADTGFAGYVAHEFMPTRDPLRSLSDAVQVCTV
jgi:hydroxypyruvate isomerase